MVKIKSGDVIRDFTQKDPNMLNLWRCGGNNYVLYRAISVKKESVGGLRMSSPDHTTANENKIFPLKNITRASQTIGIWENRS
jgi:hypothetical protein